MLKPEKYNSLYLDFPSEQIVALFYANIWFDQNVRLCNTAKDGPLPLVANPDGKQQSFEPHKIRKGKVVVDLHRPCGKAIESR